MTDTQSAVDEALAELDESTKVVVNDDGTKTVTLDVPVTINGKEVTSVTFRRPSGRDWRRTDEEKGEVGKAYRLAASISGLPMQVFDDMDGNDALLCSAVAGKMGKKLTTGGTS